MPATLLRGSSATVLCHPIPGATPNSAIPGLEKATRNQLLAFLDVVDARGHAVVLNVSPSGGGGLGYAELVAWYGRHGFVCTTEGSMRRPPTPRRSL